MNDADNKVLILFIFIIYKFVFIFESGEVTKLISAGAFARESLQGTVTVAVTHSHCLPCKSFNEFIFTCIFCYA